jgi:hypothetical protein
MPRDDPRQPLHCRRVMQPLQKSSQLSNRPFLSTTRAVAMRCPFRPVMSRPKIESFIAVPWCGLPIEAGGDPGYGIVGGISRDERVTDALQHLELDPVPVSAKRVYVGCRHRWPDQEIGSALRNERRDVGWQGPRRVLREQYPPGFDGRQITDRKKLPIQPKVGARRIKTSNHRSIHSFASRSITGSAAGDTR